MFDGWWRRPEPHVDVAWQQAKEPNFRALFESHANNAEFMNGLARRCDDLEGKIAHIHGVVDGIRQSDRETDKLAEHIASMGVWGAALANEIGELIKLAGHRTEETAATLRRRVPTIECYGRSPLLDAMNDKTRDDMKPKRKPRRSRARKK